jgi:methyl-accepting chemotaxis protein
MISQTRDRVQSLVVGQAETEAKSIAASVAADVGALASAARTMSGVISHGHQMGTLDRKAVIDILKTNLEQQPSAFGSWFAEEPKAFDNRQAEAKGKLDLAGSKKSGAFNPYWTKNKSGEPTFSTFDEDYPAEWYAVSAKTLKGAITKPYVAQALDEPTAMSSVSYPVLSGGKLIGVAGVDVSLSMLSKSLAQLTPFGTGKVLLVSHDGKWLVAPTAELLNKPYDGAAPENIKSAMEAGAVSLIPDLTNGNG